MWSLPLLSLALAQAPDDALTVSVSVDDRAARRLHAPRVALGEGSSMRLVDDGSAPGDVAGDGVWVGRGQVPRRESLTLGVSDEGAALGSFEVALPASGAASFAFRSQVGDEPLVMDLKAPAPPDLQAAPAQGDDSIAVRLVLDDRALRRLRQPRLVIAGAPPVSLRDDGEDGDEQADDGIFLGQTTVQRAQHLSLEVVDEGASAGQLTAFLPSSGEALLRVRTTEQGVELLSEAQPTEQLSGPATGPDRLAHVLWVAIALFAVAFAWVRQVAWRTWRDEVQPLVRRVERLLDTMGVPPDKGAP